MTQVLIETQLIAKKFSNKPVFTDINISAFKGRNLTIIGGSGEGKSVLLKCILGLIKPESGEVFYKDSLLKGKNREEFFSNFGVLFQGAALFDSLPVWENISFRFKYSKSLSHKARRKLAEEKLELVGLPISSANLFPAELSGGMQKRVGLARAISTNPTILFFDEPTSGLDPIMANTINNLIRKIVTDLGATAITISHDLNSIKMIADDVALLHNGRIEWHGDISEFEKTENERIKRFIKPN